MSKKIITLNLDLRKILFLLIFLWILFFLITTNFENTNPIQTRIHSFIWKLNEHDKRKEEKVRKFYGDMKTIFKDVDTKENSVLENYVIYKHIF